MQTVVSLAGLLKWRVWHDRATNAPRACPHCKHPLNLPRNDPGFPDLVMIRGDTLIVAELKSERGKLTQQQTEWLAAFGNVRRIVVGAPWRPSDWQAIERTLR